MTGVLIRKQCEDRREEHYVKMEADIIVVWPQAKKCWQPQKLEETRNRLSFRASGGSVALPTS